MNSTTAACYHALNHIFRPGRQGYYLPDQTLDNPNFGSNLSDEYKSNSAAYPYLNIDDDGEDNKATPPTFSGTSTQVATQVRGPCLPETASAAGSPWRTMKFQQGIAQISLHACTSQQTKPVFCPFRHMSSTMVVVSCLERWRAKTSHAGTGQSTRVSPLSIFFLPAHPCFVFPTQHYDA